MTRRASLLLASIVLAGATACEPTGQPRPQADPPPQNAKNKRDVAMYQVEWHGDRTFLMHYLEPPSKIKKVAEKRADNDFVTIWWFVVTVKPGDYLYLDGGPASIRDKDRKGVAICSIYWNGQERHEPVSSGTCYADFTVPAA